jgi:hypothetical protein
MCSTVPRWAQQIENRTLRLWTKGEPILTVCARRAVGTTRSQPLRRVAAGVRKGRLGSVEKLADRIVGIDGAEVLEVVTAAVDRNTSRIDGLEARVDLVELGHDLSDERLMWVALDERLCRLEESDRELMHLLRRLVGEA